MWRKSKRFRAGVVLFLTIVMSLQGGCAVWRPFGLPFEEEAPKPSLPEDYQHYYDYPAGPIQEEIVSEKTTKHYRLKQVEFPLRLPEKIQLSNPEKYKRDVEELSKTDRKKADDLELQYINRIDYYIPKKLKPGERRPAILISPILGGNMAVDRFANYYVGRGYIAALVHRKRLEWNDDRGMEQMEDYMRVSIIRLRQALDWLEVQPEVDADRIGGFAISYGAIMHAILAAVDSRVKHHVLAMPAGPLPEVVVNCPDHAITRLLKHVKEKYGWDREKVRKDLKAVLKTDPIYLAPYVPRERVLYYIALFDRVVGASRSWALWRKMGKPKLRVMPFGHYGGILVFPFLQTQSYRSFKKHLK